MVNWKLKAILTDKFRTQSDAAEALGMHESKLSAIVRGRRQPSERDREAFARAFGEKDVDRLLQS